MKAKIWFAVLSIFALAAGLRADVFQGIVTRVEDGDTIAVYDSLTRTTYTVCFADADAPELGQASGEDARHYLSNIAFGKHVIVAYTETDSLGRIVGRVYTDDGRELGLRMIEAGYAWHNDIFYNDPVYAQAQIRARAAKFGLWLIINPVAPWDYRALRPGARPAPRHPAPPNRRPPAPPVAVNVHGPGPRPHGAPPAPAPHHPAPPPPPKPGRPAPKPSAAPAHHGAVPPPAPRPNAYNGARPAPAPKPAPGHASNPAHKPGALPAPPKPGHHRPHP